MASISRKGKAASNGGSDPSTARMTPIESGDDLVCPRCGHAIGDSPYCAECGLHVAVEPETTRAEWEAAQHATSTPEPAPVKKKPSAVNVVLPIVGAVALIALGLAVYSLVSKPDTTPLQNQIASLQAKVASLQGRVTNQGQSISTDQNNITQLQTNSQAGTVSSLKGQVALLSGRVGKLSTCIPEIQQQINGMNVQTNYQNSGGTSWLTSAYLSNPTIVSSNCRKTLNGP